MNGGGEDEYLVRLWTGRILSEAGVGRWKSQRGTVDR